MTRPSDFDLCDSTWRRIASGHGDGALAMDFAPQERVVVLVWTLFGIVENGGFEYLFGSDLPGDPGYRLAVAAFRTIGCEEGAGVIEEAIALCPQAAEGDAQQRKAAFMAHPQEIRTSLATRLWALEEEMMKQLARYIQSTGLAGAGHVR